MGTRRKKVAIVDYDMGNVDSVFRAVEECGGEPILTYQEEHFREADAIVLPGVGSFAHGMHNIKSRHLDEVLLKQVICKRKPFLGICLGLQLLARRGWEGGETDGLGWIEGEVRRFQPTRPNTRIPHIGWNEVVQTQPSALFNHIPSGKDFYFVHSYHFICTHEKHVIARTPYCSGLVSAVADENIFGVQFHPEKSQKVGFQLISNFLSLDSGEYNY